MYTNLALCLDEKGALVCQKYINSSLRPIEVKMYSFNGKTPYIFGVKWISSKKRITGNYDSNWNKLDGDIIPKPKNIKKNIINLKI